MRLQKASPTERDSALRSVSFTSKTSADISADAMDFHGRSTLRSSANIDIAGDGSMSFHGRTSIYHVMFDAETTCRNNAIPYTSEVPVMNVDSVLQHFKIDLDADIVTQSLLCFFKWQYPNYMFVYRDAFIKDHFGERQRGKYWSHSLLLSICALGSLMLSHDERTDFGERYRDAAETIAMVTDLTHPSITAVQTFLCLAFYEIGSGNHSKGWAFSGKAECEGDFYA